MDDVRYSELVFLQMLATDSPDFQNFHCHFDQAKVVGLSLSTYVDMAATLLEDLFVRFHDQDMQLMVARLRGELVPSYPCPRGIHDYQWANPREGIQNVLMGPVLQKLRITYRGLRRIEALRELLRRDRILEHFGVLLDWRYIHTDLQEELQRPPEIPVSVLYADLDRFKAVNDKFGHAAGDVVLKAYLEAVRNLLGSFGTGYRGRGDEVFAIITGQGHDRAASIAEMIRKTVGTMKCAYKGTRLPKVTTSIGVATTPPELRTVDIESVAEERNRQAKATGRNRVIDKPRKTPA